MPKYLVEVKDWPIRIDGKSYYKGDNFHLEGSQFDSSFEKYLIFHGEVSEDQSNPSKELDKEATKLLEKQLEDMTEEELKEFAEKNNIVLGKARSKEGIIKKILEK